MDIPSYSHQRLKGLPPGKLTVRPWKSPIFNGFTSLPTPILSIRVEVLIYQRVNYPSSWLTYKKMLDTLIPLVSGGLEAVLCWHRQMPCSQAQREGEMPRCGQGASAIENLGHFIGQNSWDWWSCYFGAFHRQLKSIPIWKKYSIR